MHAGHCTHRLRLISVVPQHPSLPEVAWAGQILACTCWCAKRSFKLSSTMPARKNPCPEGTAVSQSGKVGSEPDLPCGKATAAHWPQQLHLSQTGAPLQKPTSTFAPRFLRRNVHSTGSANYPNRLSGGHDANGALEADALKAGLGKAAAGGTPVDPILGGELVVRLIDAQVSSYYCWICCETRIACCEINGGQQRLVEDSLPVAISF